MMPASGAVEAIGAWRFHRQGTCIGTADAARREKQRLTEHQVSCSDTGESADDLSA